MRLDGRLVEYSWLLLRLRAGPGRLLDASSASTSATSRRTLARRDADLHLDARTGVPMAMRTAHCLARLRGSADACFRELVK